MNRIFNSVSTLILISIMIAGCADGVNPVSPDENDAGVSLERIVEKSGAPILWGYYDLRFDFENCEIEVIPNRIVEFNANVVNFLNNSSSGLSIEINDTPTGPGYVDVDIDITLRHPFPGMQQYNGYDVRGVFMGDGSEVLESTGVTCAVNGPDQFMMPSPDTGHGGPDGYSRWYNYPEFATGGMPLLSYTQGKLATPGFDGSATLNPYMYFADGLGATDDLWDYLQQDGNLNGVFSSGAVNTRNYYLRFPSPSPGVVYGYVVTACWEGVDDDDHPANASEAVACKVVDNSNVYYIDETENGGGIDLEISLFNWVGLPSGIIVESTVLENPHNLTSSEMVPVGSGDNYSTWAVEIPADEVDGPDFQEYWIIAQYEPFDYSNDFGVPNDAEDEILTAYFRYDLEVLGEVPCPSPVVNGIDFDPPNGVVNPPASVFTGCELYGTNFTGSAVSIEFIGNDEIPVENINSNGTDLVIFDADFSQASTGDLYDLYVENECGGNETWEDYIQIMPMIIPWGGQPGPGPIVIDPSVNGIEAVDIAVVGEILDPTTEEVQEDLSGAIFFIYKVSDSEVRVDHFDPTGATVLDTNNISGISGVEIGYGNTVIAAAKGDQSEVPYIWREGVAGLIGPDVYFHGHVTLEDLQLWYDWGAGPAPHLDATCHMINDITYNEYTSAAGHSRGTWGSWICTFHKYVPTYGTGGNYTQITNGDINFDGAMDGKVIALGEGGANIMDYDPVAWCAHEESPHLRRYSDSGFAAWHSSGTTAGVEGTNDGEIHDPLDITIGNYNNRLYALDQPETGLTRIQCFDAKTGVFLATSVKYDMSAEGGGAPYRLDYNDYESLIYVLYDNNTFQVFKDFSE